MLDPASIGLIITGVKKAAELTNTLLDAKADIGQVTSGLGKLFEAQDQIKLAEKELKSSKKKNKNINQMAMDLAVAKENSERQLRELKDKMYWSYPNGAKVYKDFLKNRARFIREEKEAREAEKKRKQALIDNIIHYGTIVAILGFGGFMIWFLIDFAIQAGQKAGKW